MEAIYISSNSFLVSGNKTSEFITDRRVKLNCAIDGIKYATVVSSSYSSPNTTVIIDENTLTSNLVSVLYGIIQPGVEGSLPNHNHDGSEGSGGVSNHSFLTELDYVSSGHTGFASTTALTTVSGDLQTNIDSKSDTEHLHDGRYYTETEIDSDLTTLSGNLQTNIDGKPDIEVFLVEGVPSNSIGKENDVAIDQEVGDIYEKLYSVTSTTWNPADKHANITLSNGNLTAHFSTSGHRAVRSILGKSSGKWYWEVTIDFAAADGGHYLGIGTADAPLDDGVGINVYSYGFRTGGYKYCAGASPVEYGDDYTTGDVISIALDIDNGKIWFAKNGTWQGTPTGDPAGNQYEACSGLSGTFYAMWSGYRNGCQVTANFGGSAFSYSVPFGFSGGLGGGVVEWDKKLTPDLLKLVDTPGSYDNGKYLRSTLSGTEWATVSGTGVSNHSSLTELDYASAGHTGFASEALLTTTSGDLQTNIDGKSDVTLFLTEGTPSSSLGGEDDIAIDQTVGTVYKKIEQYEDVTPGTFYPAVGADDGFFTDDSFYGTNSELLIGVWWGGISVFVRFPNITIPQGSIITEAFIRFTAKENDSDGTGSKVYFNASDDAVAPTTFTEGNNLSLTSYTSWSMPAWTAGNQYDTPSIVSILQQVIDRDGWGSGNAAMVVIKDVSGKEREACAIEGSSGTKKAELHVTWEQLLEELVWDEKLSPDLLKLSDTPSSYDNEKYLRSTLSGTEWATVSGTFIELIDTPGSYEEGKYLRSTTSSTEFVYNEVLNINHEYNDYNIALFDDVVIVSGTNVYVLPLASNSKLIRIAKCDSGTTTTISGGVGDYIQGDTTVDLVTQYSVLTLIPDGINKWYEG